MGATYTRQSTFTDGDVIDSDIFNNEFDQLLAAFASSTGHTHDGTAGEGGPITGLITDGIVFGTNTGDITLTWNGGSNDGLITWKEDEDYFEFNDDLLIATTEKIQFRDTGIYINSSADGQLDLVADTEIQIAATTIDINGNVNVSGTLTIGNAGISEAELEILDGATVTTDELNILDGVTATASEINTLDGITSTVAELNILDGVTATTAELNILDGVTSTFAELNILDGVTATTAELNILDGVTATAAELNILDGVTSTATELNLLDGKAFLDEDNMASNSATGIASQQSIKAYVDSQVTAQDLDLTDGTTSIAIDLDSEALSVLGGTGVTSTASGNGVTLAIDSTVATLTGSQTLTNKSLTSPTLTGTAVVASLDISGDVDVDGTLETDALSINGTAITSTAAELNILDGKAFLDEDNLASDSATGIASQQSIKAYVDGLTTTSITATGALNSGSITSGFGNIDNGSSTITTTGAITGGSFVIGSADINENDLESIDGITAGTVAASKAVVVDANKDATGFRNITLTGELDAGSLDVSGNVDVDGTLETDALSINGTAVTSTATELNILDGVTSTTAELNILDGVTSTAAELNILDGKAFLDEDNFASNSATGIASQQSIKAYVDGITATNITSTGALNSGSITSGFGNIDTGSSTITTTGLISGGSLDIDNVLINGTTIGHTDDTDLITLADGVVTVAGEVSMTTLDIGGTNVTSTAAELNALDGITAVVGELNALDLGSTAIGTAIASKAVVIDANKDYTGIRNFSITGNLSVGGTTTVVDTVTMNAQNAILFEGATADAHETTLTIVDPTADRTISLPNQSGTVPVLAASSNTAITSTPEELNILDGVTSTATELNLLDGVTSTTAELNILDGVTSTAAELNILDVDNSTLGDLSEISTVANDDVFLAIDTSGGGLKKITRSTVVSGLAATSNSLSNIVEDTTPQLGGNLDTNSHNILIDDAHFIGDESGNEQLVFQTTASAVNHLEITNNATGSNPILAAVGGDDNVGIVLTPKGTGEIVIGAGNLNYAGTAITSTGAEINILDGVTSTTAELNILDGVTSTAAELNILDGVTSTAAELNILDGVTSTAAELNILDGVTSTAAELNILDGVTSTAAELNILDGATVVVGEINALDLGTTAVGTAIASKAVILDSNKDYTGIRNLTISGEIDAATGDFSGNVDVDGTLEADAITVNGTALATVIAGTTVTNATNSAHVLVTDNESTNEENLIAFVEGATSTTGNVGLEMDGNFAYNPSSGTVSATVFKGNIDAVDGDFDGTLEADTLSLNGTTVTSTAAELNILDGVTSTAAELNILDGVTSTAAELNALDGITAVVGELNALDLGITAVGTAIASKAMVLDSNKDYTGVRNFTLSGELDAGSLDISGDADIDGTLEADAITVNGTALAEVISDTVGAMVSSNTESGITVTYQDADNTLDFAVGTLNQNTTGSAATLTTARTIGGVSFNGSASINLPGVNTGGNQNTTGSAATLTTARAIAVAGDVTGTANFDGSAGISITTTLAADAIVTANITDGNVTLAKMAANSIDSAQYVDGSIDTAHIADGQITNAKLGADSVNGAKIADDAINSEHYVDGSIDRAHLAADIIDGTKIANDAINSEHYAAGSIDAEHLASDSVTEAKMAANSVDSQAYVDGSIDQVHLANAIVNEAKMQISNAPTNGYVLTAQSGNTGGLTWAEASGGGTETIVVSASDISTTTLSANGTFSGGTNGRWGFLSTTLTGDSNNQSRSGSLTTNGSNSHLIITGWGTNNQNINRPGSVIGAGTSSTGGLNNGEENYTSYRFKIDAGANLVSSTNAGIQTDIQYIDL